MKYERIRSTKLFYIINYPEQGENNAEDDNNMKIKVVHSPKVLLSQKS